MSHSPRPSKDTSTVVDLLAWWAAIQPGDMLYRFLRYEQTGSAAFSPISAPNDLPAAEGYTYGGMDAEARRIAVWLKTRFDAASAWCWRFLRDPNTSRRISVAFTRA